MSYKLLISVACDSPSRDQSCLNTHIVEFEEWSQAEKAYQEVSDRDRTSDILSYEATKLY